MPRYTVEATIRFEQHVTLSVEADSYQAARERVQTEANALDDCHAEDLSTVHAGDSEWVSDTVYSVRIPRFSSARTDMATDYTPVMPGEPICGVEGPPDYTVSVCMEAPDHTGNHRDDDGNKWPND